MIHAYRYVVNTFVKFKCDTNPYMTKETATDRLVQAFEKSGFESASALARVSGIPDPTVRAYLNGTRNITMPASLKLAKALRVDASWLYGSPVFELPTPNASNVTELTLPSPTNRIPIYGHAAGGSDGSFVMNGERLDDITAPPGLERAIGAYAVYVVGDSMSPRYDSGEIVFVHPGKPCRPRDYVVIQIAPEVEGDPPLGFVKRLVSYTSSKLVVEQFNPVKRIEFDGKLVLKVHRVVMAGEG